MNMQFRAVKGMNDLLPGDLIHWRRLEEAFRRRVSLHGFGEVRTPIVESLQLFVRSIGEVTDVVQKEMYAFQHHKEQLALRPEGTASAARAYVEHKIYAQEHATRWFYMGPMYRAERPQRGRYRQFFQAGCEVYGESGPGVDAELMAMLVALFRELGLQDLTVHINSLGSGESRERYKTALLDYLRPRQTELSELSQQRLESNPLRVLDSKSPQDQAVVADAPSLLDVLSEEDLAHFEGLKAHLDALEVPYVVEPRMVRGLDYYTRTLFEIRSNQGDLGAQNTLAGGGRYDKMVEGLGGPACPAFGFALGMERLLLALGPQESDLSPLVFLAPLGKTAELELVKLGQVLRSQGVRCIVDTRGVAIKSMLKRATALGAQLAVIAGDNELSADLYQLKDFTTHEQIELSREALIQRLSADSSGAGKA